MLEIQNLKKHFVMDDSLFSWFGDSTAVKAVNEISFEVHEGEILGLVGESGCGKTTTGKMIVGLHEPTSGEIIYRGENLVSSKKARKKNRKNIQLIFQDPFSSLNPRKSIYTILREPLKKHDIVPADEIDDRIDELLNITGLDPSFKKRYPHELSGGQAQRVGIARAISVEPELVVADEPVSKLDVSVQAQIINLLKDLQKRLDLSIIFIAHDLKVVKHISDRVAVMYSGELVEIGPTDEIFDNPHHPYTKSLLSAIPNPDVKTKIKQKEVLEGEPPDPINPPSGCKFHPRCPDYIGEICEKDKPQSRDVVDKRVSCHLYDSD